MENVETLIGNYYNKTSIDTSLNTHYYTQTYIDTNYHNEKPSFYSNNQSKVK